MRNRWIMLMLSFGLYCHSTWAVMCGTYTGKQEAPSKAAAGTIEKAVAAVKTKNRNGLFAISSKKLLLLRRSVSGQSDSRAGNIRLGLRHNDLDSNLNILIGDQVLPEFSSKTLFDSINIGAAITVDREVCEEARSCDDLLPTSDAVPFMFNDLMQCNTNGKGVYVFKNGLFVADMQMVPGKVPVGSAMFFNKTEKGYQLAALIIEH